MTFPLKKNVCISAIYDGTFVSTYVANVNQNVSTVGESKAFCIQFNKRVNSF